MQNIVRASMSEDGHTVYSAWYQGILFHTLFSLSCDGFIGSTQQIA